MNATKNSLAVWRGADTACVRVSGRATMQTSPDFRQLMRHLHQQGTQCVILDLAGCSLMDSTFLGVLARVAHDYQAAVPADSEPRIELLNPTDRVRGLIENLGVMHLFRLAQLNGPVGQYEEFQPDGTASKREMTQTCLDAHFTLMNLNPANIPKFKDVTEFLTGELTRLDGDTSAGTR